MRDTAMTWTLSGAVFDKPPLEVRIITLAQAPELLLYRTHRVHSLDKLGLKAVDCIDWKYNALLSNLDIEPSVRVVELFWASSCKDRNENL
jgi:hypothetical protein